MKTRRLLRLLPALAVLALSAALVACNTSEDKRDLSEGQPVQLGDLQYNIVFSRFLNPNDVEDHEYLVGQPAPKPGQLYLGVFVQILNKNKNSPVTVPSGWTITDTEHNNYYPLPSRSPYALRLGAPIGPQDQAPALDSTPQVGPIEGSMVLFSIPDSATEVRPIRLIIPGEGGPAEIELDV
ncbi:MAG: hypothetical protein AABM43_07755 [Actinomycetota bacterium]